MTIPSRIWAEQERYVKYFGASRAGLCVWRVDCLRTGPTQLSSRRSLLTIHWRVSLRLRLASADINVALVCWYLVCNAFG
jgi:hypothetical protein